jgi:hypothetical protein
MMSDERFGLFGNIFLTILGIVLWWIGRFKRCFVAKKSRREGE